MALIEEAGGKAVAVTADVSDAAEVRAVVDAAVDRFGSLDVAVTGVFLALHAESRQMRTQPPSGGAVVNIASTFGAHTRHPGAAAYAATKAAVSVLTRGAALDHIRDGVRINAVSPGAVDTTMSLGPGETAAERAERMRDAVPLGRVSATEEIAAAVLLSGLGRGGLGRRHGPGGRQRRHRLRNPLAERRRALLPWRAWCPPTVSSPSRPCRSC